MGEIIPFPELPINFELLCKSGKHLGNNFFIQGQEVGEKFHFLFPFPILKINFETLGINDKHFVKEIF